MHFRRQGQRLTHIQVQCNPSKLDTLHGAISKVKGHPVVLRHKYTCMCTTVQVLYYSFLLAALVSRDQPWNV